MDDQALTVDDLVTGKAAGQLGEGVFPVSALLIVETMSEQGSGLRIVRSEGMMSWTAIGVLRSVLLRTEDEDLRSWEEDADP